MITSLGTWRLVIPRSESTIASGGPVLVGGVDRPLDRRPLSSGSFSIAFSSAAEPVVGVDADGCERVAVLGEHVGEVGPDRVAEDDRVRHPHHRRLQVDREEDALLLGVVDLLGQEVIERRAAHHRGVEHLARLTRVLSLRTVDVAVRIDVLDPDRRRPRRPSPIARSSGSRRRSSSTRASVSPATTRPSSAGAGGRTP